MLGDEVNRAPAKTQAALLEAMQERQVTVDGTTYRLPRPFLVVATQNPIEHEGTYALPEAQLDRFLLRTRMGYPAAADEAELLTRRVERGTDEVELTAVGSVEAILGPAGRGRAGARRPGDGPLRRRRWPRAPGTTPRSRSASAPEARWPCSSWPGPSRWGGGATSSIPTT